MPDIINALRDARIAAGRSQADVGYALGKTGTALSYWEGGQRSPSLPDLEAWAAELGMGVSVAEQVSDPGDVGEWIRSQPTGVYRLFWYSGGCSVAAVGMLNDGSRWYAPANWGGVDSGGVASADWSSVKSAELIESWQASRRKRPRKAGS